METLKGIQVTIFVHAFAMLWIGIQSEAPSSQCCALNTTLLDKKKLSDRISTLPQCKDSQSINYCSNSSGNYIVYESCSSEYFSYIHAPARYCIENTNVIHSKTLICSVITTEKKNESNTRRWTILATVKTISSLFFTITLIIYGLLPGKKNIYRKAIMSMIATNAIESAVFAVIYMEKLVNFLGFAFRVGTGYFHYLSVSACATWFHIVAFNVWRTVWFPTLPVKEKTLFLIYLATGSIVPLCLLTWAVLADYIEGPHIRTQLKTGGMLLSESLSRWTFACGPYLLIFLINIVYLVLGKVKLSRMRRTNPQNAGIKVAKYKWKTFMKLMIVESISWIFYFTGNAYPQLDNYIFWSVFRVLNNLLGLWYFLILIPMRKEVRCYLTN